MTNERKEELRSEKKELKRYKTMFQNAASTSINRLGNSYVAKLDMLREDANNGSDMAQGLVEYLESLGYTYTSITWANDPSQMRNILQTIAFRCDDLISIKSATLKSLRR